MTALLCFTSLFTLTQWVTRTIWMDGFSRCHMQKEQNKRNKKTLLVTHLQKYACISK